MGSILYLMVYAGSMSSTSLSVFQPYLSLFAFGESYKAPRFDLTNTSFLKVSGAKLILSLKWVNPIVEKLRSEAAVELAMLISSMANFWNVG